MSDNEEEQLASSSDSDDSDSSSSTIYPSEQPVNLLFEPGENIAMNELFSPQINQALQDRPAFPQLPFLNGPERTGHHVLQNGMNRLTNGQSNNIDLGNMIQESQIITLPVMANGRPSSLNEYEEMIRNGKKKKKNAPLNNSHLSTFKSADGPAMHSTKREVKIFDAEPIHNAVKTRSSNTLLVPVTFRYKCAFGQCRRIIRGDVNFVYHLWAHVALVDCNAMEPFSDSPNNSPQQGSSQSIPGTDYNVRCPECLLVFQVPMLLQMHYSRVHSYNKSYIPQTACKICEKDFYKKYDLKEHLQSHKYADAPYYCRICGFRSNARENLIYHYTQKHRDSGVLMCPFCTWTSILPKSHLNADQWSIREPLVSANKFIEHMWGHATKTKTICNLCSINITNEHTNQPDAHAINAHKAAHNFMVNSNDFNITLDAECRRGTYRSKLVIPNEQCDECKKQISSLLRQNERCPECNRKGFWKRAYEACGAKEGPRGSSYYCKCGMTTTNISKLAYHFEMTRHPFKLEKEVKSKNPGKTIIVVSDKLYFKENYEKIIGNGNMKVENPKKIVQKDSDDDEPVEMCSHYRERIISNEPVQLLSNKPAQKNIKVSPGYLDDEEGSDQSVSSSIREIDVILDRLSKDEPKTNESSQSDGGEVEKKPKELEEELPIGLMEADKFAKSRYIYLTGLTEDEDLREAKRFGQGQNREFAVAMERREYAAKCREEAEFNDLVKEVKSIDRTKFLKEHENLRRRLQSELKTDHLHGFTSYADYLKEIEKRSGPGTKSAVGNSLKRGAPSSSSSDNLPKRPVSIMKPMQTRLKRLMEQHHREHVHIDGPHPDQESNEDEASEEMPILECVIQEAPPGPQPLSTKQNYEEGEIKLAVQKATTLADTIVSSIPTTSKNPVVPSKETKSKIRQSKRLQRKRIEALHPEADAGDSLPVYQENDNQSGLSNLQL